MAKTPVVLVTGFEPFDGESVNPSWETASRLHGWKIPSPAGSGGPIGVVRAERLPCEFGAALQALDEALARHRPIAVIGLGLAGSRLDISVERVAINVDDARIPDNAGRQPIDEAIVTDGPAAYFSTLPIKTIVADLRAAGIPASISQSAGTFVCNHVFYGLAHRLALSPGAPRGGFIHLPWLPEQAALAEGRPSLALATMIEAIRLAVRATLDFGGKDLKLVAGAIA